MARCAWAYASAPRILLANARHLRRRAFFSRTPDIFGAAHSSCECPTSSTPRILLRDAGDAFAPLELGKDVRRAGAVPREQHHAVEPQVSGFPDEVQFITVLG